VLALLLVLAVVEQHLALQVHQLPVRVVGVVETMLQLLIHPLVVRAVQAVVELVEIRAQMEPLVLPIRVAVAVEPVVKLLVVVRGATVVLVSLSLKFHLRTMPHSHLV